MYAKRFTVCVLAASTCAVLACSDERIAGADLSVAEGSNLAPFHSAAFILDFNVSNGTLKISAPVGSDYRGIAGNATITSHSGLGFSLLGAGIVELLATNFTAGPVGAVAPGKVLITFDLTVRNQLAGVQLATPTFPVPPPGVTGVQAFPFETSWVPTSSATGEFVVVSHVTGPVIASADWDGEPHNFLNDLGCPAVSSTDCFRYENFGVIGPLGLSAARRVGFLVDLNVRAFRVKLVLAADLQTAAP
ncbi:MAG: hypothetical protein H7Z40_12685 [Phycisphaerae bacterium]|nr:hypothetical protein [Gemmatimonadaceae bacterium]